MRSNRSIPDAEVIPVLIYPEVREAVDWLTRAFGFRERLKIGEAHRSQINVGERGAVVAADVRGERAPPRPGVVTHMVMVRVARLDEHCERARAAGARILDEPHDNPFGERQYVAADPAGHQWVFSESTADVDPAEWGGELREL
ncbi:MAG TPA: VOC family protein [Solirubrobacteraceae bacterium]|nr:VOC family protein [Solirubrobacteraceae bacterium]